MGGLLSQSVDVESASSPQAEESFISRNASRFIDPRSPSFEINRTPIIVPEPIQTAIDPRSPSEGIERTPISYLLPQKYRRTCATATTDVSQRIPEKIPPLIFEDEVDVDSAPEEEEEGVKLVETSIETQENSNESRNDTDLESVKISPEKDLMESAGYEPLETMPSPILPLILDGSDIETPTEILTSTKISSPPSSISSCTASTKVTLPKSTVPAATTTVTTTTTIVAPRPYYPLGANRKPCLPSMIPVGSQKRRPDPSANGGLGWKKTTGFPFQTRGDSEGRSPLLNRNREESAFSPVLGNVPPQGRVLPIYKQNPLRLRGRNTDAENDRFAAVHNKENVTIMWEN